MKQLVLVDGNSIANRAFYGIMGNKMLMTSDGTYTNAVYGFLSILFKIMDDIKPEYMAVAFDLKAPTKRHKMYEGYKATRKGMPDELASQMPIIKEILQAMNIKIVEKEGYEADDILGTLSRVGERNECSVTILSGDRDTFQLVTDNIKVRIPRTKMGKTETEDFTEEKIEEVYGLTPKKLIEVKGLMGDSSDNIPGIPGVGEKTALNLVKKYNSIDELYKKIELGEDDLKGATREKIVNNKDLAILSKELGTIEINVPLNIKIDELKVKEWDKDKILEIFNKLKFNRFIERFNLNDGKSNKNEKVELNIKVIEIENIDNIIKQIENEKQLYYYFGKKESDSDDNIINKEIENISIYNNNKDEIYYIKINNEEIFKEKLKNIFESKDILKIRV